MRARRAGGNAFERLWLTRCEHLLVVAHESARRLFRVQLQIVLTDDLGRWPVQEPRKRLIDQHVSALEVLHEDCIGRRFDDCLQKVVTVWDPHHASL